MAKHELEIKDSNGATVGVELMVPPVGNATWRVKYNRFLRLQDGVADRGPADQPSQGDWLACYGGQEMDDKLLVFHLDDFFDGIAVKRSGGGTLYNHDNLFMVPGPLTWRVLWTV